MTTPSPTSIRKVKVLADLLEPGDEIVNAGEVSTIEKIKRFRKRLRLVVLLELADGRTVEVNAGKFVNTPIRPPEG